MKVHFSSNLEDSGKTGIYYVNQYSYCGSTKFGGRRPQMTDDWDKVTCTKCKPSLRLAKAGV